ncbi:DoxX family membrane protein [Actinokineospora soli]|uniref:DoxX family membrane protein n=1 Tax=Actinokineospora soli TaxID=1048753 RepID=A0ABW2TQZ5_9PSEU
MSLGVVFVWFGGLKLAGVTPVAEVVAGTVPWLDPEGFVVGLGVVEVVLGAALVVGWRVRWVALLVAGHLGGRSSCWSCSRGWRSRRGIPWC